MTKARADGRTDPMCLACEEQEYFFRAWCAGFVARGEMPPGVTAEDLDAMGFDLPAAMKVKEQGKEQGKGRSEDKPQQPTTAVPPASAFSCDSPDGE